MNLPALDVTRQATGLAGLIFAVVGVVTEHPVVVWIAIGFLAISVAIRMVVRSRRRRSE